MNYTVVIVEDERIIRDELKMVIPFKQLDFTLLATAENGIEGKRIIEEYHPDIVITDIRLPGLDGLSMIQEAQGEFETIILTGFSDFTYMKTAIKIHVFDYLLKPVDDEAFIQVLKELKSKMERAHSSSPDTPSVHLLPLITDVQNYLVAKSIEFICLNYDKPIGLKEAADTLQVSETHLSRLFSEYVQMNFLKYLNTYRINKSLILLTTTTLNINEI
jgi:two-component system response regulator YesN